MDKPERFTNRARSTLVSGINNSVTTFSIASGSTFPSDGDFRIRVDDEIMIVGTRSGGTLSSITRGAEGTSAVSHSAGVAVTHPLTAASVQRAFQGADECEVEFLAATAGQVTRASRIPYDCIVTGWSMLADLSGSVVIDIRKTVFASTPPGPGDTIVAADPPTLSGAIRGTSASLTGWDTELDEGDWINFAIDSVSTITELVFVLHVRRVS